MDSQNKPPIINDFRFGKIVIDHVSYKKDLIIFPDHITTNWRRKKGHFLQIEDIEEVLESAPEHLIIGCGTFSRMTVSQEIITRLKERGIHVTIQNTQNACKTYQKLSREKRTVACLHLTC